MFILDEVKKLGWFKENKSKIIIAAGISAVLTIAYFSGGTSQNNVPMISEENSYKTSQISELSETSEISEISESFEISELSEISVSSKNEISENENSSISQSIVSENSVVDESINKKSSKPERLKSNIDENTTESKFEDNVESNIESYIESSIISYIEISNNNDNSKLQENIPSAVISTPETTSPESKIESSVPVQSSVISQTSSQKTESSLLQISKYEPVSEPENVNTCTITISCEILLNHMNELSNEIKTLIPADGIIIKNAKVQFSDGESVFDVLKRACMENNIHLDFSITPLYGGAYIKGINNIYEFDCGNLSGWLYSVNDVFGSTGCSDYKIKSGDDIKFQYSCDLGKDIGDDYYKMGG